MKKLILIVSAVLLIGLLAVLSSQTPAAYPGSYLVQNDTSTGTTFQKLAGISAGKAILSGTSDTSSIGVVVQNPGTTGSAVIAFSGIVGVVVDGTTTIDHFVVLSTTIAGDAHDSGASTYPSSGVVVGRVVQASTGTASVSQVLLNKDILTVAAGALTGSGTNGKITKWTGSSSLGNAVAADVVALFSACSGTQYLGADGACHSSGTSTTLWPIYMPLAYCYNNGASGQPGGGVQKVAEVLFGCGISSDITKFPDNMDFITNGVTNIVDLILGPLQGWDSGNMSMTMSLSFNTDNNTGHIAQFGISPGCRLAGSSTVTKVFDAPQVFNVNPAATVNSIVNGSFTALGNTSGCGPNDLRIIRIIRTSGGSDTITGDILTYVAVVNYTRNL